MYHYYILKNKTPVIVSMHEWARWFENTDNRRINSTTIGKVFISTVFMGIDHDFSGHGPPLLFETMVFGGPLDGEITRCAFYKQAQRQHTEMVAEVNMALARLKNIFPQSTD
jgi:hypothetical protein